ncbi:hypothetical protein [Ureibacillus manganicus]|uniref:Uncharacterized protein n=1 Tax=Ureibacillus manganicus DSM 26584 TaxID=1384049 RepID=A0A0A3I695_9BACL|nr:hypothetical protein [Ureibacillus manganicus]KGR80244.1 hypothetical protein CD29_02500 [Ureibacillus manganicus DSM 26584]
MKILSSLNDNYKLEERKFESQRKEMAKAYKRSSTFIEASKNPVNNLINDLLKSEIDLPKQLLKPIINTEISLAELEVASSSHFDDGEFELNRFHHLKNDILHRYEKTKTDYLATTYETAIKENIFRNDLKYRKFQKAISSYKFHMNLAHNTFVNGKSQYIITA